MTQALQDYQDRPRHQPHQQPRINGAAFIDPCLDENVKMWEPTQDDLPIGTFVLVIKGKNCNYQGGVSNVHENEYKTITVEFYDDNFRPMNLSVKKVTAPSYLKILKPEYVAALTRE